MTERSAAMADFLARSGWGGVASVPLAADASFRRYDRLARDGRSVVLMDAPPPVELEKIGAYVAIAGMLRGCGLSAPEIYAEDREHGFLLIEDFGNDSYTRLLAGGADEAELYALAIDVLIGLHRAVADGSPPELPPYDEARLLTEVALVPEWYAPNALGRPLDPAAAQDYLARWRQVLALAALPPTLVLRDYHIDNLMLLPHRTGVQRCGLLDIQDALWGPPSYDLVSLLEDVRRDVPAALRTAMTDRYLAAFPDLDRAPFLRSCAIMGVQRNCKILGLFVRLWRRDGKPGYLQHLPRAWRLIEEDLQREPALAPIGDWLDRHLPPALRHLPPVRSAA